jgi:hypothetical protein
VPVASRLPSFRVEQQLYEGEAAAWQLQAHAAALQIVLMEVCMDAPPAKVRHKCDWVLTVHVRYLGVYGVGNSMPLCPGSRSERAGK